MKTLERRGHFSAADAAFEAGFVPQFSLIGAWDNEQGKAFDTRPPEKGIQPDSSYPGIRGTAEWIPGRSETRRGWIEIQERIQPGVWSAAFLGTTLHAKSQWSGTLIFHTSVPVRIWVNGTPAYEARFAEGVRSHAFSLPLTLREGSNSILIKTAQRTGSWNWGARLYPDVGHREESILQAPLSPHPPTADGSFSRSPETEMEERGLQPKESARQAYRAAMWWRELGQQQARVDSLEASLERFEESLILRALFTMALWNNGEMARTSTLLND